jgi:alpha-ketoglutarate-dependent taurine dioxygenase
MIRILTAKRVEKGVFVRIRRDGIERETVFHRFWLADNCDSSVRFEGNSQKHTNAPDRFVRTVDFDDRKIRVKWEDEGTSEFDVMWLSKYVTHEEDNSKMKKTTIPNFRDYKDVLENPDPFTFEDVYENGLGILKNVPTNVDVREHLTRLTLGPTSHNALYGDTFAVVDKGKKKAENVAYTNVALALHQDLAYYESPPGLQILFCLKQSDNGGESTFADAHAAAESLRIKDPDAFRVLLKEKCTFQKIHDLREVPARYIYRRPHIELNDKGLVNAVFWSPPFEGPFMSSLSSSFDNEEDSAIVVENYYHAYRSFREEILRHQVQVRLSPGDMAIWNQRRVLHGRNSFEGGERHMQGAYVNIDDFASRVRKCANWNGFECGNDVLFGNRGNCG